MREARERKTRSNSCIRKHMRARSVSSDDDWHTSCSASWTSGAPLSASQTTFQYSGQHHVLNGGGDPHMAAKKKTAKKKGTKKKAAKKKK
jgi:hypothetical protein